jgi:cytochrome c-type biogenesis protein CcmH
VSAARRALRPAVPLAWLLLQLLCILCLSMPVSYAVDLTPALPTPELQQRYYQLTHELRCMQCYNEALADSNVGLAADLRLQVHDLLLTGKTDQEVRDHMVARYGEFILFRPQMSWRNAWLWGAPSALLIGGALIGVRVLRRRSQLAGTDNDSLEEPEVR